MLMLHSWLSALLGESHWHTIPVINSIKQTSNRSISQSVNHSVNQSIKQSIHPSIDQSIDRSINQSINQSSALAEQVNAAI
jgi:hypothetical protein